MTPVLWTTILLSCSHPAATQSSFSPFSLLGSLFSSGPNWPQSRPRPDSRQPVARQSRQPPGGPGGPGGLHFRSKIPLGHKFSASQVIFMPSQPSLAHHSIILLSLYLLNGLTEKKTNNKVSLSFNSIKLK